MIKQIFTFLILVFCALYLVNAQEYLRPGNLNPILPGYFADPTIKKIGDTYYIYATTDGNGGGLGPSQVWTSKDFLNWTIQPMNWPNTHWYWAPDMTKGYDGKYYLYYSQPVEIYAASSSNPAGPWTPMNADGKSIIPNYMIPGVITLDAQTFTDDDGKIYMYWGTWGIYPDHGCAVGLLNKDMKTFEKVKLIPNTDAKDFFEAPYVFKRNGIYYFMYSSGHCEDHTYRVQYAMSKVGPMGPFEYATNNPILSTNEDGTIHGPGHHSLIEENGKYYIVYHRHNNPFSGGGFHRQLAVDELLFESDGRIKKIVPTHKGADALLKKNNLPENVAFQKSVSASSFYSEDFKPFFVLDDNNGTLWRSKENHLPAWITIDLEKATDIRTVLLQFEYPTYAYQYRIETSTDGNTWTLYSDQSQNNRWASPILEHGNVKARYVRVHILNTQHPGLTKGIWNIKIYSQSFPQQTLWSDPQQMPMNEVAIGRLVHIHAGDQVEGSSFNSIQNQGLLVGNFQSQQSLMVKTYQGKRAFYFDGKNVLKSSFKVPMNLIGNNPFTVSMWVNNPIASRYEDVLAYSKGTQDLTRAVFGVGTDANKGAVTHGAWPDMGFKSAPAANIWNHIVYTFDGYMERIYVNGELQKEQNRMLFIKPNEHFILGASDLLDNHFSGYLADLKIFNSSVGEDFIVEEKKAFYASTSYFSLRTADISIGKVSSIRNQGTIDPLYISFDQAEIAAKGNKTALLTSILRDKTLEDILKQHDYYLEFDLYEESKWNHYIYNRTKGNVVLYKNGQQTSVKSLKGLRINTDFSLTILSPIHFFNAYPTSIALEQVASSFSSWKNTFNAQLIALKPQVIAAPRFINDQDVFVHIQKNYSNVQYAFSVGKNNSGWQEEPFYLSPVTAEDKEIKVQLKDEFGNISQVNTFAIPNIRPTLMSGSGMNSTYSLKKGSLPFWDGMQLSSDVDSTKTKIDFNNNSWRIASTHTKWNAKDLLPPFLFKDLKGDFTIQVKINDVAGLQNKTRTSNEAGIMIRSKEDERAYLNNTILTGWNLGNLWRSVGPRIHQEANNGIGLNFHPYIQIQKFNSLFFFRTSADGILWENLPNTPCKREDLEGVALQVGIYQIATNNQEGYGVFSDVKIWN